MENYAQYYHEAQSGWVDVRDRLPENKQMVLCISSNGNIYVRKYIRKYILTCINGFYDATKYPLQITLTITHWQPLPPPAKTETI